MRLDVALLPRLLRRPENCVCLLIDVLRASSSIVTLLARGADEVVVAGSTTMARRIAATEPDRYLLCGEVLGVAPRGFDYGNSPSEFAEVHCGAIASSFQRRTGRRRCAGFARRRRQSSGRC